MWHNCGFTCQYNLLKMGSVHYQAKKSTEECSKIKSPETKQIKERLVSTLEHTSPNIGQNQVTGGVRVICWHAAPLHNEVRSQR